jgi:hypothetical protein
MTKAAEDGEGFDVIDAIAGFGIDVASGEVVGDVQGGELGGEERKIS